MRLFTHSIALMLIITSIALSQETPVPSRYSIEFSASTGLAFPYLPQDFFDQTNDGMHYGISSSWLFSPGSIGYSAVNFTLGYDLFEPNKSSLQRIKNLTGAQWEASGGETEIMTALLEYKGTFSTRITLAPYFLVGIGAERFNQKAITISNGSTTHNVESIDRYTFAWDIGLGLDLPINDQLSFFNEGKYIIGVGTDSHTQHVYVGSGIRFKL